MLNNAESREVNSVGTIPMSFGQINDFNLNEILDRDRWKWSRKTAAPALDPTSRWRWILFSVRQQQKLFPIASTTLIFFNQSATGRDLKLGEDVAKVILDCTLLDTEDVCNFLIR